MFVPSLSWKRSDRVSSENGGSKFTKQAFVLSVRTQRPRWIGPTLVLPIHKAIARSIGCIRVPVLSGAEATVLWHEYHRVRRVRRAHSRRPCRQRKENTNQHTTRYVLSASHMRYRPRRFAKTGSGQA